MNNLGEQSPGRAAETEISTVWSGLSTEALSAARKQHLRELLLAASAARGGGFRPDFELDASPLFTPEVSDLLFGRFCEAIADRARVGESFAGAPTLLRALVGEVQKEDQLTGETIAELLRVQQRLTGAAEPVGGRLEILPHVAAVTLSRPGLGGKRAPDSLKALGDILMFAPPSISPHRLLRDLLPILADSVHISDLRLFSALLQSESLAEGRQVSYDIFIATCPQLRALGGALWGECKAAGLVAISNGFQGARVLLKGFAALVEANCPRQAQRAYLLALTELPKDPLAPHHGNVAALVASAWSVLPPPDRACRDLIASLTSSDGAGLHARLVRLTTCCFERVLSDEVHWDTLLKMTGFERRAPSAEPRHKIFRALSDLQRGYASSLGFDTRRLPGESVSPLARAALQVGDLQLVHSDDFRSFPGHGIVVSRLQPAKIFANLGRNEVEAMSNMRKALPSLARSLDTLGGAKIAVLPALLVITPPEEMRLSLGPADRRNFSLIVYSQEQRQPSLIKALLVDSDWLWSRIEPCLKEWRPTWNAKGPQQEARDVANAGLRPEAILSCNRPGQTVALDIASPSTLIGGFSCSLPHYNLPEPQVSARFLRQSGQTLFGHTAVHDFNLPADALRKVVRQYDRISENIQVYLGGTLRYFDAFRLAHANIHKGLAAQLRPRPDYSIAPQGRPPSIDALQHDPRLDMLVDALKLHQTLAPDGGKPLPTDWMLVSAGALYYADPPDGDFILDVRTLQAWVDKIPFSLFESESTTITDATRNRWLDLLERRFATSLYQDLRFVERRFLQQER